MMNTADEDRRGSHQMSLEGVIRGRHQREVILKRKSAVEVSNRSQQNKSAGEVSTARKQRKSA